MGPLGACQQPALTTDSNGHVALPPGDVGQGQTHCVAVILEDQVCAVGCQLAVGKGCLLALWHQVMGCAAAVQQAWASAVLAMSWVKVETIRIMLGTVTQQADAVCFARE
jgi:hypothetical protein